jgi:hypothetical protein
MRNRPQSFQWVHMSGLQLEPLLGLVNCAGKKGAGSTRAEAGTYSDESSGAVLWSRVQCLTSAG